MPKIRHGWYEEQLDAFTDNFESDAEDVLERFSAVFSEISCRTVAKWGLRWCANRTEATALLREARKTLEDIEDNYLSGFEEHFGVGLDNFKFYTNLKTELEPWEDIKLPKVEEITQATGQKEQNHE